MNEFLGNLTETTKTSKAIPSITIETGAPFFSNEGQTLKSEN